MSLRKILEDNLKTFKRLYRQDVYNIVRENGYDFDTARRELDEIEGVKKEYGYNSRNKKAIKWWDYGETCKHLRIDCEICLKSKQTNLWT